VAPAAGPAIDLGDRRVPVADVCAKLLLQARELAERQLRRPVAQAVLTVEGGLPEAGRAALREAAGQAGLEVLGLIDEAVAAAVVAGAAEEIVGVYDLGGGGFGFSLVELAGDRARVVAREAAPEVCGAELAEALADAIADAFWRTHGIELREAVVPWQRLLLACEDATWTLAIEEHAEVIVRGLVAAPDPIDLVDTVSRVTLEAAAADLARRSLGVCRRVLDSAGLAPSGLQRLLAVGGGSRLALVRREVARFFGRPPAEPGRLAPEEAIVAGAARRAAAVIRLA
jgi:molecular chaperone DnaK